MEGSLGLRDRDWGSRFVGSYEYFIPSLLIAQSSHNSAFFWGPFWGVGVEGGGGCSIGSYNKRVGFGISVWDLGGKGVWDLGGKARGSQV